MHFLQVAAIAICLAAVFLSPVQCSCQLGCNCGIPGCNCGGGEQCPSSEGGPSEQGNPNEGISISFTESPSDYFGPTMNQGSSYAGSTTEPAVWGVYCTGDNSCCTVAKEPSGNYMFQQLANVDYTTAMNWMKSNGYGGYGGCLASAPSIAEYNVYCTGDTNCCTVSKEPTGNYMFGQFPSKVDYTTAMNWMKTSGYTNGGCKASSSPYSPYTEYSSPYVQNTPANLGIPNPQNNLVPETEAATPSEQGLVTPAGEQIGPGSKITLSPISPKDKITLGARCTDFVELLSGNMGEDRSLYQAIFALAYLRLHGTISEETGQYNSKGEPETEITDAFKQSVLDLMKCVYVCHKLYSGGYDQPLTVQSASKTPLLLGSLRKPSGSPAQIGLHLESGPLLSEVVNNGVSLDVDTATATVSSVGNNTFGVVYDPKNSFSYIVAYQRPVKILPKNNSLAPFTLNGSQAVIVDAKNVSQIVPLSSISTNASSNVYGSGSTPSNQSSIEPTDNLQKLEQLKKMLDAGLITQEDYNSTKNQILSRI